ncbi:MAG TPA: M12 family metallo-peptidase [Casimicrobiaceae bacterium]|nr:M12 family metallo-peptidase [Casimicrobiaceae bacterium]
MFGPTTARASVKSSEMTTIRARPVRPNVRLVQRLARDHVEASIEGAFVLDLFPGLELTARVVDAKVRTTGATVVAKLPDVQYGTAVLTLESGVLTGTVDFPGGSFLISRGGEGTYRVQQKAQQLYPPELPPRVVPSETKRSTDRPSIQTKDVPQDSGRLIDIMVVWTPAAQASAGGTAPMQSLAQAAVDGTNAIFLNSGIGNRLRLVHAQRVDYVERTSCGDVTLSCALDDITRQGDGLLDEVHALRDQHGADLVAFIVADHPQYCGLAWLPDTISTANAWSGFSVTARGCALGNKTFAHELGHNLGAHHDPANADSSGPKPYNRGYIDPQRNWRTVMAYGAPCNFCTRLGYFSNPRLTHSDGDALGTALQSNNALVLNLTGKAVASYRSTSPLHPIAPRYEDVGALHPFYGHIEFLGQAGISHGCSNVAFCAEETVTRGQMAVFLERVMRASNWTPPSPSGGFFDVPATSPFASYIEQLYVDGITSGCSSAPLGYCPNDPVTRAQMAVLMLNAACGPAYTPSAPASQIFIDVPLDHPNVAEIHKLHAMGVTRGCASAPMMYCPTAAITRGQIAAFLERAFPLRTPSEACTP